MKYDNIDAEYDVVLAKQNVKSKGKTIDSKRIKGEKKKEKPKYNSKFIRSKVKKF